MPQKHPRCEACEKDRATKPPLPKSKVGLRPIRTKQPLEGLHCDLVGAIELPAPGKQYQYLLVVMMTILSIYQPNHSEQKDQTTDALIEMINMLEKTSIESRKSREANSGTRTSRSNYDRGGSNSKKPYPGIAKQMR